MAKSPLRPLLPFCFLFVIFAAWTFAIQDFPFFWDAIQLGSKHAHFFYENNLNWALLPAEIDSGHPPIFGYWLAVVWTIFGKSLPASHWAMFPFLVGTAVSLLALGKRLGTSAWAFWLIPIVFLDPVVAGQSTLVGPDIVLVCFFLLAVEGLLGGKRFWALLGILGLCTISMRGMMTAGALFAWQILMHWPLRQPFSKLLRTSLLFLPGFGLAIAFLSWHYAGTGWIGYHPDSPWAPAFAPVGGAGMLRNFLILGWRWLDFGRIFEWIVLACLLRSTPLKSVLKQAPGQNLKPLLLLLICLLVFLSPSAIIYQNLSAHRYFLPGFLCLHLLVFHWVAVQNVSLWKKNILFGLLVLGLATGNCWIYPQGISMDWDSTLAHLPYHRLRAEMVDFIDAEEIPYSSIGTAFPNINSGEILALNGDERCFASMDWQQNKYMLVSNIFNDVSASDYQHLERDWVPVKALENRGVWMTLYQKP